jgi:diguanylate cyclase (GGDEF)-like protein/PAS domain S-box-containing protein
MASLELDAGRWQTGSGSVDKARYAPLKHGANFPISPLMSASTASTVRRRATTYVSLMLGLAAASLPLAKLGWSGNAWIHTILESIATLFAFLIGGIALVRYYAQKSIGYLLLGTAFLAAGSSVGFHAVVTSPSCGACDPPYLLGVISWSGYISDLFLSLLMCGRILAWKDERSDFEIINRHARSLFLAVSALMLGAFTFFQFVPLPLEYYPSFPIYRPAAMLTGALYGIAAIGHWRKGGWKSVSYDHWLMLYLITSAVAQLFYVPWSVEYFDSMNCVSHALGIVAGSFLLAGLLSSMVSIFRNAERALHDQERVSESLTQEIGIRQRAEAELEEARRKLEARVAESTEELAEQDELANLGANIAVALTQSDDVEETLQRSAEIICRSIGASLVRIWTLNREDVLDLRASAGIHAGLNGYERVRVGEFRVGRVAQEGKPFLTNSIQEDPLVGNREWLRSVGIISYAGQPLMLEDHVEGVIMVCASKPLKDMVMQALGSIAGSLGLFVGRKRAQAALAESEERVRLLLDSTAEAIIGADLEGNCTFVNRTGLLMLGYENQEDLLGKNIHALTHHTWSDGRPHLASECKIGTALGRGEPSHADDDIFWRADGTSFPVEYWSYPVKKAGKMVGAVGTFLDISARKRAEEEQRKLVTLIESSRDFIAMASPDKKLIYLNGGGAAMVGVAPQDAIGMDISRFHPNQAWEKLQPTFPILLETGRYQCESQLKHFATGAVIDVLLDSFVIRKPETGEILSIAAIMRDVTERKQNDEALRTSEERFRIAAENAGDQTIDVDLRTGQAQVFGTVPARLGDWPAPATFEGWKNVVHPDDLARTLEDRERCFKSGEPYVGEYRVVGQRGDIFHYSVRAQAIRNAVGEAIRYIGVVSDITGQKKAAESVAQLAAIVQSSEDAMAGCDLSGIISTWNRGAEKMLGYASSEAVGQPLSILLAQPNEMAEIRERCLRGEISRFDQTFLICKSGEALPVSLTVSPIRGKSGRVTGLAAIARDMRAQVKAENELAYQAQHDHLTGLPNRLMLADRLEASIRIAGSSSLMAAVIYLDLDGFKLVNDTLGHEAGDLLLQQVTDRLRACVREPDTLARMGGDEFMVVVNELRDDKLALLVAERLAEALRSPFWVQERELYLTASVGISMYPRDGTDVSSLRRNADAAMYQAKHMGKDRVLFFTPRMRDSFLERLELQTDLRHALDNREFVLYFQPIFEAAHCRRTAFEALVRWNHPVRGLVSPDNFISVTEETGLIVRLGAWVLGEACRECRIWQDGELSSVRVAVNVSPLEFTRANFAESVIGAIDEIGLPGELLELEITEGILMRDIEGSIKKMSRLRERGVRISIDDFGSGYSSLGYLPRLPVDTLKIDRSFVAELGVNSTAHSLIEGIISLAHSIGKRVIVEGVETDWQLDTLRELGADEIQGFLLGRPAPLAQFATRRVLPGTSVAKESQAAELLEHISP